MKVIVENRDNLIDFGMDGKTALKIKKTKEANQDAKLTSV